MKKVEKIEDFTKEVSKTDKYLSKLGIASLVISIGLCTGVTVNELFKKNNGIVTEKNNVVIENVAPTNNNVVSSNNSTSSSSSYKDYVWKKASAPTYYDKEEIISTDESSVDESYIVEGTQEYKVIGENTVEAVLSVVYELPTGFVFKTDSEGNSYGSRKMVKVSGHEDYVYQIYGEQEQFTIIDYGSYFEIRTVPNKLEIYIVPNGYELQCDKDGNYYGVKVKTKSLK